MRGQALHVLGLGAAELHDPTSAGPVIKQQRAHLLLRHSAVAGGECRDELRHQPDGLYHPWGVSSRGGLKDPCTVPVWYHQECA